MQTFKSILICFIVTIFLFLTTKGKATPEDKIDSLQQVLAEYLSENKDTRSTIQILNQLFELTKLSQQYLALEFAAQAMQLSKNIGDSLLISGWYMKLGDMYFNQRVYYQAMDSYVKAYDIFLDFNKKEEVAFCMIKIGSTYFVQNIDNAALDYFVKAAEIFKELNNEEGISITIDKIGLIYLRQYQYEAAIENFNKALEIRSKSKNANMIAQSYCNLAEVSKQLDEYHEAIEYLGEALKKFKIGGEIINVASTYFELGELYTRLEQYKNAHENFDKAFNLYTEMGINYNIASTLLKIGNVYFLQKQYSKALEYAGEAMQIAIEYDILEQRKDAYLLFAYIFAAQGNMSKAYLQMQNYASAKDSLNDEKKQDRFSELQANMEAQRKEKEIEVLKREDALREQQQKKLQILVYALFGGVALILAFALYYFYSSRKEKHVNNLLLQMNEEVNVQKEEILASAENLEKINQTMLEQKNELEEKGNKIDASIHYAGRIQEAMFTKSSAVQLHFIDSFIFHRPKEAVSGDFYWLSTVKKSSSPSLFKTKMVDNESPKTVVSVVDCTGHGVPGAFMSMLGDSYLNQIVNIQKITDPDKILAELHKSIRLALRQEETENNDGMDVALCVMDKTHKTLEFSGAKNPIVFIQNNKIHRINGDLMSIGGLQKEKERIFSKHTIDISVPTMVYLFSDGYQDQFGGKYGRKFMAKPFREMLYEIHQLPCEDQKKILNHRLIEWMGNYPQMDDITVVGFKI